MTMSMDEMRIALQRRMVKDLGRLREEDPEGHKRLIDAAKSYKAHGRLPDGFDEGDPVIQKFFFGRKKAS